MGRQVERKETQRVALSLHSLLCSLSMSSGIGPTVGHAIFLLVLIIVNSSFLWFYVKLQLLASWPGSPYCVHHRMGCTPSSIEPMVCAYDEDKFLEKWSQCGTGNKVISKQSSSDISLVKVERKSNSNMAPGTCTSASWIDEIPELAIFVLLFLFVLTLFRRWQGKRRNKAFRKALAENSVQLQTVTSNIPFAGGLNEERAWRGMGKRCLDG